MPSSVLFLGLTLSSIIAASSANNEWAYFVKKDTKLNLTCYDSRYYPFNQAAPGNVTSNISLIEWYLPNRLEPGIPAAHKALYHLSVDNATLTIEKATQETYGIYHCAVLSNDTWSYIKRGLNIHGARYENLLDKYQQNFINAGIASGSFLGFCILVSLIYTFRYKGDKNKVSDSEYATSDDACPTTSL